jgi:predicted site-specific integrase-resolvase
MVEPTYNSIGEFAETYGISRKEMSRYITLGVVKPRKTQHGAAELSETDAMRIAQYNTKNRENNH